jgi:hypothetical protein
MKKEILINQTKDISGMQAYVWNPRKQKWIHAGRIRRGYTALMVVNSFLRNTLDKQNAVQYGGYGGFLPITVEFPYMTTKEWSITLAVLNCCK